ncbi:MAG: hypothetical protein ACOYMN_22670, partial [Roseimicrobium sp.]
MKFASPLLLIAFFAVSAAFSQTPIEKDISDYLNKAQLSIRQGKHVQLFELALDEVIMRKKDGTSYEFKPEPPAGAPLNG